MSIPQSKPANPFTQLLSLKIKQKKMNTGTFNNLLRLAEELASTAVCPASKLLAEVKDSEHSQI
jgi:hypothetical protein